MDERAKIETIGVGLQNRHILHYLFRFKLTFRSRLLCGDVAILLFAETSTKSSSVINRVV